MKRIVALFIISIIVYSIYYDLTEGTIQSSHASIQLSTESEANEVPYVTRQIQRGDTVISIAENIHQGPLPVSIERLIEDFQMLNEDIQPDEIQIGQHYQFPLYDNNNRQE